MSKINNIMKINNKENLKSFFNRYGASNHIMMTVILNHTPDIIKNMIEIEQSQHFMYIKKRNGWHMQTERNRFQNCS